MDIGPPGVPVEVGYANLAIGLIAMAAAGLNWGSVACGMCLLTYGTYLLCALLLHATKPCMLQKSGLVPQKVSSMTVFFVAALYHIWISRSCGGKCYPMLKSGVTDCLPDMVRVTRI